MAKKWKKKRHGDNGIVIATAIITLLFVISAGYLLGGDNLVNTVFQKEEVKEKTFYFLTTDTFDDVTIARQNADLIRARGGAGYVDMREGNRIILAVYPDEQSAKSVREKLGDNSIIIVELPISKYTLDLKKKDLTEAGNDALKYFDIAFDGLYNLSNSLANNTITIEDVKVKINVLRTQIEDIKSTFYEKTKDANQDAITEIKVALVTCIAIIDAVEIGNYATTLSSLRRQGVQLVYCYQSLKTALFID